MRSRLLDCMQSSHIRLAGDACDSRGDVVNAQRLFVVPVAALLVLSTGSCARESSDYQSFVASRDAIRPGMSIRQVFEAGLADYLVKAGGKNVPGATLPEKQPVSFCRDSRPTRRGRSR